MKKFNLLLILIFCLATFILQAQPNYSEDIAPIIYENCTNCHRQGEIAPFPLENYEDAAAYAPTIKYVTGIRYMPPWKPDPEYSEFMGERFLTEAEIQLIADWVDAGMPEGDPNLAPEPPSFPEGSVIGTPDLVLSMAEAYEHQGNMTDEYRVFVLPTGLTEDKEIASVEVRPGNRKIVHHALISYDVTGEAQSLDNGTPEYGYQAFGGFGVDAAFDKQFPAYVPGARPPYYQAGMGQKLPAGSDLLIQMHYAPIAANEIDSSSVNIFFKKEPVTREVKQYVMLPFGGTLTNGPFFIQANQVKTFHGVYTVPSSISILGTGPHMHLLGQDWEVFIKHQNGDTTNLISIPEWDFNWQSGYFYKSPIAAMPGDELHAYATYDNTADNPLNPNNPPINVGWGDFTTDEMFYLPFFYVPYQAGDEDIIFDENFTPTEEEELLLPKSRLFPIYPNPTADEITVGFELVKSQQVSVQILNVEGKLIRDMIENENYPTGHHKISQNVEDLPNGLYFINLVGENFVISEKFTVNN